MEPNTITSKTPFAQTLQGLDWLNFFLSDLQTAIGSFLAIYLAGLGWHEQVVGVGCRVSQSV